MVHDHGWPWWRALRAWAGGLGQRPARRRPTLECLEGRQLLSDAPVRLPSQAIVHTAGGAAYLIAITGPGAVTTSGAGHGQVNINLLGTTNDSQVTVTPKLLRPRFLGTHLQVARINVRTGALGSFQALNTVDLVGPLSPLNGTVASLQFDAIAGPAQVITNGSLGGLVVAGDVNLAPGGLVRAAGPATIGGNLIDGGQFSSAGALNVGRDIQVRPGATFNAGPLTVGGSLALSPGVAIGLGGPTVVGADLVANGARIELASAGALNVGQDLDVLAGGQVHVTGDRTAPITIGRNLVLDAGRLVLDAPAHTLRPADLMPFYG